MLTPPSPRTKLSAGEFKNTLIRFEKYTHTIPPHSEIRRTSSPRLTILKLEDLRKHTTPPAPLLRLARSRPQDKYRQSSFTTCIPIPHCISCIPVPHSASVCYVFVHLDPSAQHRYLAGHFRPAQRLGEVIDGIHFPVDFTNLQAAPLHGLLEPEITKFYVSRFSQPAAAGYSPGPLCI